MTNSKTQSEGFSKVAEETKAMLEATADATEEAIIAARERLKSALETAEETYEQVKSRAIAGAKATDGWIHENPYKALGLAFGAGALFALFMSRRGRD